MLPIRTLHDIDTEYAADSIEWCPHPLYNKYFVCGTYQLEINGDNTISAACKRKGRIYLYEFIKNTCATVREVQRIEMCAILDMKWLTQPQSFTTFPILSVASATGEIEMFQLNVNHLKKVASINIGQDTSSLMALSLDWSRAVKNDESSAYRLLCSDSKGGVHALDFFVEGSQLNKVKSWPCHKFEAWICAFDKWDSNVCYTGGDDTFLHSYDLRTSNRILINKSHNAGVTCLLSHGQREHLLFTGSYDEHLRTFDTRAMKQPLFELNLGGGIWRIKSDPLDVNLILTACMYHNFTIVHVERNDLTKVVGEFNVHNSICYGADWCMDAQKDDEHLFMATCSFYDHKLCIAEVKIK